MNVNPIFFTGNKISFPKRILLPEHTYKNMEIKYILQLAYIRKKREILKFLFPCRQGFF